MEDRKLEIPLSKRPPIVWKRPPEFFKKAGSDEAEFFLFENIEPNDIKQGLLGDCWLMCSLSAVAEFPVLIQSAFVGDEDRYSHEGVYQV